MSKFFQCPLFKGLSPDEISLLLENHCTVKTYHAGELIALQASMYDHLLIVMEGYVRGEMTDTLGRSTLIEEIQAPRAIAPAFLYATENRLPVSIIAAVPTQLAVIHRTDFTKMMQQDARILTNYLQSMADRSRFLSEKLRMQRFGTIKNKLAKYLLEMSQRLANGQSPLLEFTIPHTQQQLADIFGITRPALARSIKQLENDQVIQTKSKQFKILDRKKLLES